MNYYQVLRVSSKASAMEIDRAYQKLIKEARFDTNVIRKDLETAYRVLRDPTQKALYDAAIAQDTKQTTLRIKKHVKVDISIKHLAAILTVLLIISGIFFFIRFGYLLKSFDKGDVIVSRSNGKVIGKILGEQDNHSFGKVRRDAYLIQTPKGDVYIPKEQVKLTCEKK